MYFSGPLYAVNSMAVARKFYEDVLGQVVILDFGTNITFAGPGPEGKGGFSLQEGFGELVGFPPQNIHYKSWDGELYFETDTFEADCQRIKDASAELLHEEKEYPWGQHTLRFFDPDGHLVELGESMKSVVLRWLAQGLTEEETAQRTMHPLEFVRACKNGLI